MVKIGIIGGSGLDDPKLLKESHETDVETPYGKPTSPLTTGRMDGVEVVLISRHGKRHNLSPSAVNFRANIHALKEENVSAILATTACGSLKEEIGRGDLVILDQFIDFTRFRRNTFHDSFDNGVVHTSLADPFDKRLSRMLYETALEAGCRVHPTGCVVTIEGPRFSTRAESKMFRLWGGDVVNMSIAPEAALACEAGIPYACIAMSTDYDCWKEDEEPVTWDEILAVFNSNAEKVKQLLVAAVSNIKSI